MIFIQCRNIYYFEKINFLFTTIINVMINFKSKSFMIGNLNSNNIDNDKFNLNNEECDYKNLITKLKEIKENIALLEKIIFN